MVEHTVAAVLVHNIKTTPARCFGEIIGQIECGSMNSGFDSLFTRPIPYKVCLDWEQHRQTNEDMYGEPIKAGDLGAIIEWLQKDLDSSYYRRIPPLLGFLKGLNPDDWNTPNCPWVADENGEVEEHLEIIDFRH